MAAAFPLPGLGWLWPSARTQPKPMAFAERRRLYAKVIRHDASLEGVRLPDDIVEQFAHACSQRLDPHRGVAFYKQRFGQIMSPYRGFQNGDGI